jgi:hypothetical protein
MDQATIPNPSLGGPFRSAWSVVWRITAIPALVFMAGLTIFVLIEREPNVSAAPAQGTKHLAQLQQLKDAWIER